VSEAPGRPPEAGEHALPHTDPTLQLVQEALASLVADPTPKVLHGTGKTPAVFKGSSKGATDAAQLCIKNGWIKATGDFTGKGASRKELYAITPDGVREALEHGDTPALLEQVRGLVQANADRLKALLGAADEVRNKVIELQRELTGQQNILARILDKVKAPDIAALLQKVRPTPDGLPSAAEGWTEEALRFLAEYQRRHPSGWCSLPELYRRVAQPRGLTIGQFHDGMRELHRRGSIRLHEWTQSLREMTDEQCALLQGREVRYYVESRQQ
jgi:hypothetical protein